jgi:hypothetical protein
MPEAWFAAGRKSSSTGSEPVCVPNALKVPTRGGISALASPSEEK